MLTRAQAASAVMNFPDGKKFLKRMIRSNLIDHDANSRRYLIHAIVQSFLRRTVRSLARSLVLLRSLG
jgi:hypothetical protein